LLAWVLPLLTTVREEWQMNVYMNVHMSGHERAHADTIEHLSAGTLRSAYNRRTNYSWVVKKLPEVITSCWCDLKLGVLGTQVAVF
jgi:hypothetical protein